jgi:hypothetical protein
VHHQLAHYWDEQDCVTRGTHYTVSTDAAAASDSVTVAASSHADCQSAVRTVTAVRRTRNFFALPLSTDWQRAARGEQETLWRSEIATLSTLDTYRLFKRRLEVEAYLNDGRGMASVSGRRAAREMARLRCGVHELAISAERRQRRPGQTERLPRELRVCAWCEEQRAAVRAQARAVGDQAALDARPSPAATDAAPVEDEQHALLYCPQYAQMRVQLFDDVLDISDERDDDGCCILQSGPVRLADMLSADGGPGGAASALAIVAGGVWSRLEEKPKRTAHAWRVDAAVRQRCKLYVGRLMHCRRRWQRGRQRRGGGRSAEGRHSGIGAAGAGRAQDGQAQTRQTQLRLTGGISLGKGVGKPLTYEKPLTHGFLQGQDRRPGRAHQAWAPLLRGQSGHNALQRTGNAQAMASARIRQSSVPARQALRRQASTLRSGLAAMSGSKADNPTLTIQRGQQCSIVTYMELRASAASAAPARAPSAHSARGSRPCQR